MSQPQGAAIAMPWVEKYRPQHLNLIVDHASVISTLERMTEARDLPNLLFHGPAGTGKTTAVLACVTKMYSKSDRQRCVMEINASDDNGMNVIREQVKVFVQSTSLFVQGPPQKKMVILDECDNMTQAAQLALRRMMEDFSENARFCLICNYLQKVHPALQSRCAKFRFAPLKLPAVVQKAQEIIQAEGVSLDSPGTLEQLADFAQGDMRKVINTLQATALAEGQISAQGIFEATGLPRQSELDDLLRVIRESPLTTGLHKMRQLTLVGYSPVDVLRGLSKAFQKLPVKPEAKADCVIRLAALEAILYEGSQEILHLNSMVGALATALKA